MTRSTLIPITATRPQGHAGDSPLARPAERCSGGARRLWPLALALTLTAAGCAVSPPPDTARVSNLQFGTNQDAEIYSINLAQWVFADTSRVHNDPIDAARAVAGLDYVAGSLSTNPRWDYVSPIAQMQMLQARRDVRQALGISETASSQVVVDSLLSAATDLAHGNRAGAAAALQPPAFTRPGDEMLAQLNNLPFVSSANVATAHAAPEMQGGSSGGCGFPCP